MAADTSTAWTGRLEALSSKSFGIQTTLQKPQVVVVYQCFISNVMVTGDIDALLYTTVHAVLDC